MDGQPGNCNHSQLAKVLQKRSPGTFPGSLKDLHRLKQQTKCSGCKMSVLCLLGTVPFWWRWWYCRHGFNFTKFCGCYCKVCAFALFFQESQVVNSLFFSRSRGKKTSASLEGIKEGQALETKKKETTPPAESMKGGFTRYGSLFPVLNFHKGIMAFGEIEG